MDKTARRRTSAYAIGWRVAAALLLIVLVLASVALGRLPRWLGLYFVAAVIVSAAAYRLDKRRAIAGEWRVPETTLHLI